MFGELNSTVWIVSLFLLVAIILTIEKKGAKGLEPISKAIRVVNFTRYSFALIFVYLVFSIPHTAMFSNFDSGKIETSEIISKNQSGEDFQSLKNDIDGIKKDSQGLRRSVYELNRNYGLFLLAFFGIISFLFARSVETLKLLQTIEKTVTSEKSNIL